MTGNPPLEPAAVPGWTLEFGPEHVQPESFRASLLAISDGRTSAVDGLTLAAGAYGSGHDGLVRPLPGPVWTRLRRHGDGSRRRWHLDLRTGTLVAHDEHDGTRQLRFVSLARPGTAGLAAERAGPEDWAPPLAAPAVFAPLEAEHRWRRETVGEHEIAETISDRATVTTAAHQRTSRAGDTSRLERIAVTRSGARPRPTEASAALRRACSIGFDELLCEHQTLWKDRWRNADIEIDGDDDAQLATRFAIFHLLSCADTVGEAPVGARGMTGLAYAGHVFWDTDVFVLPALAGILPAAARAVLEYRIRRLPAARAEAAARGAPGARFPWESADTGRDVTPRTVRDIDGDVIPILSWQHEEHIVSDIAWAALRYVDWTGDTSLLDGPGRSLVTETAEYVAALARIDDHGRAHIDDVIGPDEYHERVDDNAYTNQLVRWHLRRAAPLLAEDGRAEQARRCTEIADRLVDGYHPSTGRHEQFAGYWELEPLRVRDLAEPPVAADVLLGRERVARTQIIKQPDVLMFHHLLPDECPAGSLIADLDHALPRIAHGSSLSPAICAGLLARAGRPDEAMPLFDLAARLDLDNLTGTTSAGLHLATMGGLWQAIVSGFAGIRVGPDGLRVDPHLPARWRALRVHLVVRGHPVTVSIDHDTVTVDGGDAIPVLTGDPPLVTTAGPQNRRER